MKQAKNIDKKKIAELKKIEKAIKQGFNESEKFLKSQSDKKRSGFQLCFG